MEIILETKSYVAQSALVKKPTFYAIAGIPAAGKTSFIKQMLSENRLSTNAFIHNIDNALLNMPEYQKDFHDLGSVIAFEKWELHAKESAEKKLYAAMYECKDIIYDRSCGMEYSLAFISKAVQVFNYNLIMYFLYCDIATAIQRARIREKQIGLHSPKEQIIAKSKRLAAFFPEYINIASEVYVMGSKDDSLTLIVSYENSKMTNVNQNLINSFEDYLKNP